MVHGAGKDAVGFFLRAAAARVSMAGAMSTAAASTLMTATAAAGVTSAASTRTPAGSTGTSATTTPPAFTASGTSGGVIRSNIHFVTRLVVMISKSHVYLGKIRSELGFALTVWFPSGCAIPFEDRSKRTTGCGWARLNQFSSD
jgi:hypothetical protein